MTATPRSFEFSAAELAEYSSWATRRARRLEPFDPNKVYTLAEFQQLPAPEYDWLIPGLFERRDRLIVTGGEGDGKSTLLRQLGLQASDGVHPFTGEQIDPVRVLLVDLENSDRQVAREIEGLMPLIRNTARGHFRLVVHPQGLDLAGEEDQEKLEGWISEASPELVIMGPTYKLADIDVNEETQVKGVTKYLDYLRQEYGIGLMLESHFPHAQEKGSGRPAGSRVWVRWPDFGFRIHRDGRLKYWRNPRDDDRAWPAKLQRGDLWPWSVEAWSSQQLGSNEIDTFSQDVLDLLIELGTASISQLRDAYLEFAEIDDVVTAEEKKMWWSRTQRGVRRLEQLGNPPIEEVPGTKKPTLYRAADTSDETTSD